MNELTPKAKLEQSIQQQQKKHIQLLGRQNRNKSHILWSFNTETKELKRAAFATQSNTLYLNSFNHDDVMKTIRTFYSRVLVEQNCIYFQALNEENALKKLKKERHVL
jgi:hypothetical protein